MSKVVVGTGAPQPSSSATAYSSASFPQSSSSATSYPSTVPQQTYASTAAPLLSPNGTNNMEADQSMANGSIDTCGSRGGENCKTGMCCSSHG